MKTRVNFAVIILLAVVFLPSALHAKLVGIDLQGKVWNINETTGAGVIIGDSGQPGLACLAGDYNGNLYSLYSDSFYTGKLVKIDPTNGEGVVLCDIDLNPLELAIMSALAYFKSPGAGGSGKLYALIDAFMPLGGSNENSYLCSIDIDTGVLSLIGQTGLVDDPGKITGLAMTPSGKLYGWHRNLGLVTINRTTAVLTDINESVSGPEDIEALALTLSGALYGVAGDTLYKIDRISGTCTPVAFGSYSDIRGLEHLPDMPPGNLLAVCSPTTYQGVTTPVVRIDESTGDGWPIKLSEFSGLNNLARDGKGNIYSLYADNLLKINPVNGAVVSVVTLSLSFGTEGMTGILAAPALAFSPSGVLYAILNYYEIAPDMPMWDLFVIDLETGVATPQGMGLYLDSLSFDPGGNLYGWDYGMGLARLSKSGTSWELTYVNPSGGNPNQIHSLVFAPDGILYGAGNALYRIDKSTGVATLVGAGDYSTVWGLEYVGSLPERRTHIGPIMNLLFGD